MRDLINQMKTSSDPNYCVRVTADDGALGEQWLRTFQDNEKTIPTILTTSQKLSTGVDARNVRNIVLMRPINSMIEFKQIIGRGTRLFDGKDYFTIYDFVKAYEHFNDPEWDGEPMEPVVRRSRVQGSRRRFEEESDRLRADADRRTAEANQDQAGGRQGAHHPAHDGDDASGARTASRSRRPSSSRRCSASCRTSSRTKTSCGDSGASRTRARRCCEGWPKKAMAAEQLAEISRMIDAEKSDVFDVLAYIAFALAPITRAERVDTRKADILGRYDAKLRAFLDFVLAQYIRQGVRELDQDKLSMLLELKYHSVPDAIDQLGDVPMIRDTFEGFQQYLYKQAGEASM